MGANSNLVSIDKIMDAEFGAVGTPEREEFRREAYAYYMGQLICEARKKEKITQSELAQRIGSSKSYISKVENGTIECGIAIFYQIIQALGLRLELVKQLGAL
ncbi:MAG: helix-turn-helix transcriptional regulator [Rikenellaceae bacterium]